MRTVQFTVPHNTYPPNLRYQYYWYKFLTFDRYTSIIIYKYIHCTHYHTGPEIHLYIENLCIYAYMYSYNRSRLLVPHLPHTVYCTVSQDSDSVDDHASIDDADEHNQNDHGNFEVFKMKLS